MFKSWLRPKLFVLHSESPCFTSPQKKKIPVVGSWTPLYLRSFIAKFEGLRFIQLESQGDFFLPTVAQYFRRKVPLLNCQIQREILGTVSSRASPRFFLEIDCSSMGNQWILGPLIFEIHPICLSPPCPLPHHHLSAVYFALKRNHSKNTCEPWKNPLTFHDTGRFIGILIMVYYNPNMTG